MVLKLSACKLRKAKLIYILCCLVIILNVKRRLSGLVFFSGLIGGNFFIVKIPRFAVILVRDFLTERSFIYCNIISLGYTLSQRLFLHYFCVGGVRIIFLQHCTKEYNSNGRIAL